MRLASGMTQKDFALYLGLAPRTVRAWDQGTRNPTTGIESLIYRVLVAEGVIPSNFEKPNSSEEEWL